LAFGEGGLKNRQTFYNHKIIIKIQNIFSLLLKINFLPLAGKFTAKNLYFILIFFYHMLCVLAGTQIKNRYVFDDKKIKLHLFYFLF